MDLFEASVCVPDRAKLKGAGTQAISDLVGFRAENVSASEVFFSLTNIDAPRAKPFSRSIVYMTT